MSELTLDQLLTLGGVGAGAYGGGDVVRWSPDGSQILFHASLSGESALWLVPAAGGYSRRVTTEPLRLPFLASPMQSFAPNGSRIAFLALQGEATELWLWEAHTASSRPLTAFGNQISSYAWAPDGGSLLVASNRRGTFDIYRVDTTSGSARRLTSSQQYEVSPVATPDGARVLFVRLDDTWADHDVISIAADGGDERVVARDEDFFDYQYGRTFGPPVISPAGDRVLFRSHRNGWINYWAVDAAGGRAQVVCQQAADQSGATWSPDGAQIAFVSNTNGTLSIWLCDADGGNARVLVQPEQGVCQSPAWSPDGAQIAFLQSAPDDTQDVWIVSAQGGQARRLTDSMPAGHVRERLSRPEKVTITSFDGLPISAYVYRPVPLEPGRRYPGVLIAHGGPTSQFLDVYDPLAQFLARRGYAVIMPNVRGSSGYGKQFEDLNNADWGHSDLQDAIACADWLRAQVWIDGGQIGITGTSYGGCLAMSAVCNAPGAFQAAAPHAGYADWIHVMGEQERRHLQLMRYEFGDFDENIAVYRRCSPIFNAHHVEAPVLVLHGVDEAPQSQASQRFVDALRREYKPVTYRTYPGECYYVRTRANLRRMYLDIAEFFDQHLREP